MCGKRRVRRREKVNGRERKREREREEGGVEILYEAIIQKERNHFSTGNGAKRTESVRVHMK